MASLFSTLDSNKECLLLGLLTAFLVSALGLFSGLFSALCSCAGEEVLRGESVLFSCFSGVLKIYVLSELA